MAKKNVGAATRDGNDCNVTSKLNTINDMRKLKVIILSIGEIKHTHLKVCCQRLVLFWLIPLSHIVGNTANFDNPGSG